MRKDEFLIIGVYIIDSPQIAKVKLIKDLDLLSPYECDRYCINTGVKDEKRTVEPMLNSFFRTKYIFSINKCSDGLARKQHNVQL